MCNYFCNECVFNDVKKSSQMNKSPILASLHWLPVKLTHKAFNNQFY